MHLSHTHSLSPLLFRFQIALTHKGLRTNFEDIPETILSGIWPASHNNAPRAIPPDQPPTLGVEALSVGYDTAMSPELQTFDSAAVSHPQLLAPSSAIQPSPSSNRAYRDPQPRPHPSPRPNHSPTTHARHLASRAARVNGAPGNNIPLWQQQPSTLGHSNEVELQPVGGHSRHEDDSIA